MKLTKEELKAIEYHLNYDIASCSENRIHEKMEGDVPKEEVAISALKKIRELIEQEEECSVYLNSCVLTNDYQITATQILTDVCMLDPTGQEKEIKLIIDKVKKMISTVEENLDKARKEDQVTEEGKNNN